MIQVTDRRGVHGLGQTSSATARAGTSGTRFALDAGAPQRASSAQGAAPASAMDGLLTVQASGDALERRKRAVRRGRDLLDELDQIKIAILSGRLPQASLLRLRQRLAERRDQLDDPVLTDLIAHIELRAEVEIAKLTRR